MNLLSEIGRDTNGLWLVGALLCAEGIAGLLALQNSRRECGVQAVRSTQTVAAVWFCFLLHSLVVALASWFSMWELPIAPVWAVLAGGLMATLGLGFAAAGFWEFRSLQRMSGMSSDHLVTSGIYRFSRNPQNVGWGLLLLGIALAGRSGLGCLLALGYWAVFRYYVAIEEKHLAWVFQPHWESYVARTPRFLTLAPLWRAQIRDGQPLRSRANGGRGRLQPLSLSREP